MARSWCMCAGCNRVLFQDTALWKSDKPFCEECAPKGAKRPEVFEPEEFKELITPSEETLTANTDELLNDSCTGG